MRRRLKIFFDGGCRGDPGRMELAVVTGGRATIVTDLGYGTSADAEWLALIRATTIARSLALSDVVLLGDSADVVAKANGVVRCRPDERQYLEAFRTAASGTDTPRIRHVRRSQNLAGIALARLHAR